MSGLVGITEAPKDPKMIIGRIDGVEDRGGRLVLKGGEGDKVEKITSRLKGMRPILGGDRRMKRQRPNHIDNSSDDTFGFTILGRGIGTREMKANAI